MTLIVSLLFNGLFILVILWREKDHREISKDLERERKVSDALMKDLKEERNRAESEVGKLTRGV